MAWIRTATAAAFLGAAAGAAALGGAKAETGAAGAAPASGLVTLYRNDPVTHAISLATGDFGARVSGTDFVLGPAHLDFGNYHPDALTVALSEDDRGLILDLGHQSDLAEAYRFTEEVGGGVGYASIHLRDGDLVIRRHFPEHAFQTLVEGRPITTVFRGERLASAPVVPGHVYLVRINDRKARRPDLFVRILVVSHQAGDRVTLRWEPLPVR